MKCTHFTCMIFSYFLNDFDKGAPLNVIHSLCFTLKLQMLQKLVLFPPSGKTGELNLVGLECGLYIFSTVMILTPAKLREHIKYK